MLCDSGSAVPEAAAAVLSYYVNGNANANGSPRVRRRGNLALIAGHAR